MEENIRLDDTNIMLMKLLHYFITEKDYNPIILQGAENEIWLENMDEDYKVVRIVSGHIHNNEQFEFDAFKTKRIVKKIKMKTLTFNINVLSIFLNLGENVTDTQNENYKNQINIRLTDEEDLKNNDTISKYFPDLTRKIKFKEKGLELFAKITTDINKHNENDAKKVGKIFKNKVPYITFSLIVLNVLIFFGGLALNSQEELFELFSVYAPSIRAGEYYRLITGAFLHGNFLHLLFNMYALWIVGQQLENFLGKGKYLGVYLFSAITSSLLSMAANGSNTYSVGASVAIFGIMGALVYFGLQYRVYLGNFVKNQLIPIILLNLVIGFSSTGVDNFGHIGGLIGGVLGTMALGIEGKSTTTERVNGVILSIIYVTLVIYMGFVYTA